jgi:hypothetical protein
VPSISQAPPVLVVPARFCGPPTSANGGYASAVLAQQVRDADAVTVTLRKPPPLDTPMTVVPDDRGGARLMLGDELIAEAVPAACDVELVEPVSFEEAVAATTAYPGRRRHPFPTCFACGPARRPGDGLRLEPGRLADRPDTVACPWVPHPSLAPGGETVPAEIVWAALDCPGGWIADLDPGTPRVLGRMTACVDALPYIGDQCVITGRLVEQQGRKAHTITTLYDGDGRVLARAAAVWIALGEPRAQPS